MRIRFYFIVTVLILVGFKGYSQTPTIASFTPTTGPVDASVTITGTNFSTTASNNIVYFGAAKAAVSNATATELTVTVPSGATHQPISVLANGLIAFSNSPFLVTFNGGTGITTNSYSPKVDFASGTQPSSFCIADVDLDGMTDLVVPNRGTPTLSIFRNISSGAGSIAYAAKVDLTTGATPYEAAGGDFDGDGKTDLAVVNYGSATVSVFMNTSTGSGSVSFAGKIDFTTGTQPQGIAISDIDGDGRADMAVVNITSNTVSVFRNISTGVGSINFATKIDFANPNAVSISCRDLDGDNKVDMIVANGSIASVSIYRNTSTSGSISFAAKINFTTGTNTSYVACGDFDNDGKADIAAANYSDNTLSVLRNITTAVGVINFDAKVDYPVGTSPNHVSIGDLDGDGKIDLVTSNFDSNNISVLKNTSTGAGSINYASKVDFAPGTGTAYTAIGDMDGDGRVELIAANYVSNTISVFRYGLLPTITSFNPTSGPVGTPVTIIGTNFSTTPENNTVLFNGALATITGTPTTTSITTSVPEFAPTGQITVDVGGQVAYSDTDFTVVIPPTITSFTSISGAVGTTVTITGSNFSTTASNNIVKFNGTVATITGTPTTTSITTSVPSLATTGKITVEVGGQVATSATDFTVIATPVTITAETFKNSYDKGSTLTVGITVSNAANVSAVNFKSRGISEAASAEKSKAVAAVGNKYEIVVGASDLTDPIGLVYSFEVLDKDTPTGTVLSSKGKAYIKYKASEQEIPGLTFGNQVSNYSIIAVPLELSDKSVTKVFSALGAYDKTKWRLFDYTNNDNREYSGFSTIDIGRGYWLIARNSVTINPGEGSTPAVEESAPFTINLTKGWNLIGNPYNFRVSWADVLSANPSSVGVDPTLKVFSGGALTNGTVLEKYRGAFVFANEALALKIPVVRNASLGGRIKEERVIVNSLDQNHWEVKLKLSEGPLSNELGGIGMHPAATLKGKDPFDEVSVPLPEGLNLFELAYPHPEVFTDFNKEVVPTRGNFTWDFDVKRSSKTGDLQLTWANDYFGDNEKQLVLFDPSSLQVVDMRMVNRFTVGSRADKLRILYGGKEYIQHALDKELPWLGNPYPNPAREELTIPFRVPENQDGMAVQIKIYNSLGAEVGMPVDGVLTKGNYKITWQSQGETGLFIVRMKIGQQETKATKVIVN